MRYPLTTTGAALVQSQAAWSQTLSRATDKRSRQFPRFRLSPNRVLALRLRSKNDEQKSRYRGPFRFHASVRNGRLPIVTLQMLLARQDLTLEPAPARAMAARTEADWTDGFNSLAARGWTRRQLDHWQWILSGENGDVRAQRLVATEGPTPIFLLMLLLRSDETYRQPTSLTSLIRHTTEKHMVSTTRTPTTPLNLGTILSASQFMILVRRLIYHVQRLHSPSIVAVARLAAAYITSLPNDPHHKHQRTTFRDQCTVFNTVLSCLTRPASQEPLINMEFNWRAQRVLLTMSDGLKPPLVVNKASYQALRRVLIGMKKSAEERAVALRYAKTSPPYRKDFDGRDLKRTPYDDMSRSVRAAVMMREGGYPNDHYDQALGALGGVGQGAPTIQTRSLAPTQWAGEKEFLNVYSNWAMHIRSTRNAVEAWRAFNKFAEKAELPPNFQVYTEMFLKLQASPLNTESSSDLLPGDARETFPVHDANYSQYELARQAPPTLPELYAEMMSRGIRPRGFALHNLVRNAKSVEQGLQYLQDSGFPESVVKSLGPFRVPSISALRRLPLLCFSSYIELLCRLQPNRRGWDIIPSDELCFINHAIRLVDLRLTPDTTEGATFRPPFHVILRALARPHIVVRNGSAQDNNLEALTLFMHTLQTARKGPGVDAELFLLLCRIIEKTAHSRLRSQYPAERASMVPLLPHAQDFIDKVTSIFSQLTKPIVGELSDSLPIAQFKFPLRPPHLHAYMRALAFLGAMDEMKNLILWMIDNYKFVNEEAGRLPYRGQDMIAKIFCAFHAFAEPTLDDEVLDELDGRMDRLIADGGVWRWPTEEETEKYIHLDAGGGSERLRHRIMVHLQGSVGDEDQKEADPY
ncbi:hypothetical protein F4808DRAFT_420016 [Astrocystis sublimbata]|nr:hypothetical protein F4808DRAFT_420016 [Astrocystis sublimbata]